MILIVADRHDVHADAVISGLDGIGAKYYRVDLDIDSLRRTVVTFSNNKWIIIRNEVVQNIGDISVVWCRRTTVLSDDALNNDKDNSLKLWISEWNRVLYGIYSSIINVFWLNSIRDSNLADNKYYQFEIANSVGLSIPDYLTSNCKLDLEEFAQEFEFVAMKFMSQEIYRSSTGDALGLYVNRITNKELSRFGDSSENPITLQKYINKDYEVRCTYVDGEFFACKILSQLSHRANIDWRRYDIENTPHLRTDVPHGIMRQVGVLMELLNLRFGALDFIVDCDGKWWFLEVNSTGQWLWVEDLAGLPISDCIAKCLLRHSL